MMSLNLKYVTCADVRGYMNVNLSTIHEYNGRYGKGFVRTMPCYYRGKQSTSYMTIQYWVESEVKNMDKLTQVKKNRLLKESSDKILETSPFHNDIMKMYAYIYDCTATSDTLAEIQLMETVKSSLDFLVRGVIK